MEQIKYQTLEVEHFEQVLLLANFVHGENYMNENELATVYKLSHYNGINASWVALQGEKLVGFRLTLAAGNWRVDNWCTPNLWGQPAERICYFKCSTVASAYRGKGIGSGLIKRSVEQAKHQGAKAGLAHIWLASPGNSAFLYFKKNGGHLIKEHENKWQDNSLVDSYQCPICGLICTCTAAEMILYFD